MWNQYRKKNYRGVYLTILYNVVEILQPGIFIENHRTLLSEEHQTYYLKDFEPEFVY